MFAASISTTPTNISLNFDTGISLDLNFEAGAESMSDDVDSEFNGCLDVGFEASSSYAFSGPLSFLLGAPSGGAGTVFRSSIPNLFEVSCAGKIEHRSYPPFPQKCFPGPTTRSKRSNNRFGRSMTSDKSMIKRSLTCPPSNPSDHFAPLASEIVIIF